MGGAARAGSGGRGGQLEASWAAGATSLHPPGGQGGIRPPAQHPARHRLEGTEAAKPRWWRPREADCRLETAAREVSGLCPPAACSPPAFVVGGVVAQLVARHNTAAPGGWDPPAGTSGIPHKLTGHHTRHNNTLWPLFKETPGMGPRNSPPPGSLGGRGRAPLPDCWCCPAVK